MRQYCFIFRLVPESVPWLAANDHVDKAEEILRKAAKFNKVTFPEHILKRDGEEEEMKEETPKEDNPGTTHEEPKEDNQALVNSTSGMTQIIFI